MGQASKAGHCGLGPDTQCQGSLVGGPSLKGSLAPAVASSGPPHSAQGSMRGAPARFAAHSRDDSSLPERLTGPCRPGDGGCWQECLSSGSSKSLGPVVHAAWSEGSRAPKTEKRPPSPGLNGPSYTPVLPGSQDPFTSSFSFIRLSLRAAGQRGEAEGCLPRREAELLYQSPQAMAAEAPDPGPHEDPRPLRTSSLQAPPASADSAEGTGSPSELECCLVSSRDAGLSSQAAGGAEDPGGCAWAARGWHALLKDWEPVLQGCLWSHRRQLEVTSLSLKLQKLQEKAIEGGDYDKAETLKQRLEDLEQEKGRLPWALPSQQPALHSFLSYLAAQTRVALHGATKRSCRSDPEAPPEGEPRTAAQDSLPASITRRDWLLGQKEQLQREMEGLQASMSAMQAREQQLSRELAEQELLLRWHSRDLDVAPLLARLSPSQLQEVSQVLGETLTSDGQAPPYPVEPLEALRSLRERTKSLSLAAREITAQVCSAERLCSSVRRRLGELDTRLPTLLEAKMLAVSGSHFCTAKELTEEVQALSAEREGLESLLGRLLALNSRNIRRLRSVQEDYVRSRQDLALREAAHKAAVKANTAQRMEALEGRLRRKSGHLTTEPAMTTHQP
ncbi:disrupted in schizophrenia 1 protein [Psammomys obesus]|uniref:disrupted in schizophrenia 1 protein n=1 Tax=Psammomys obesus TaxID=48139 RepID=UPI00245298E7|nr:disrupted in schizophrenia 1 protein [Psammomys obesus]